MNLKYWLFLVVVALAILFMCYVTFASKRCRDIGKVPVIGTEKFVTCVEA